MYKVPILHITTHSSVRELCVYFCFHAVTHMKSFEGSILDFIKCQSVVPAPGDQKSWSCPATNHILAQTQKLSNYCGSDVTKCQKNSQTFGVCFTETAMVSIWCVELEEVDETACSESEEEKKAKPLNLCHLNASTKPYTKMYNVTFQPAKKEGRFHPLGGWFHSPLSSMFACCLRTWKRGEVDDVHGVLPHCAVTAWQTPPVGEKVLLFSVALATPTIPALLSSTALRSGEQSSERCFSKIR